MSEEKKERKRYYNPEVANRAQQKYDATHTVRVQMKLNTTHDADILAQLECVPNKQGYIKQLIREDIAKRS